MKQFNSVHLIYLWSSNGNHFILLLFFCYYYKEIHFLSLINHKTLFSWFVSAFLDRFLYPTNRRVTYIETWLSSLWNNDFLKCLWCYFFMSGVLSVYMPSIIMNKFFSIKIFYLWLSETFMSLWLCDNFMVQIVYCIVSFVKKSIFY